MAYNLPCGKWRLVDSLNIVKTFAAYLASAHLGGNVRATAEGAVGSEFCKNYLVVFYVDFNSVAANDVHLRSDFLGNDDSAKLIYVSYYSGSLHRIPHPFV